MNYTSLSEGLRNVLSTRGITYKELAAVLSMSESGVKKMLTGEDIGFNRLASLLEFLDLKIEDLLSLSPKLYQKLTTEQERTFEKQPKLYHFFLQLHHFKMNIDALKKSNSKLSKAAMESYLQKLIEMDVIIKAEDGLRSQLVEGFRVSNSFSYKMRPKYEVLFAKLEGLESGKWESWMFGGLATLSLSEKSALELRNTMKGLLEEFSARSDREKKLHDPKDLIQTGTAFMNLPLKIQELYPLL